MRALPHEAVALVKAFEGMRLDPYRDCAGFPTVGYGHLLSRDRTLPLDTWPTIDEQEALRLLVSDLAGAARTVLWLSHVELSDGHYGALTSFAFNVGGVAFNHSTLKKRLNAGDYDGAADEFPKWKFAAGLALPGLVRRRAAERALFLS